MQNQPRSSNGWYAYSGTTSVGEDSDRCKRTSLAKRMTNSDYRILKGEQNYGKNHNRRRCSSSNK